MSNVNRLVLVLFEDDDTGYLMGVLLRCDSLPFLRSFCINVILCIFFVTNSCGDHSCHFFQHLGIKDEGEHFEALSNANINSYEQTKIPAYCPNFPYLLSFSLPNNFPSLALSTKQKSKSTNKHF